MSQQSFLQTTATGSDINFTITTFSSDEILVYVDGVKKTAGVHYNINPYNSNGQSTVDWIGTAPSSPSVIRVVRQTDVLNNGNTAVEGRATFTPGSSVKADDLNNNTKQVLRSLQEHNDQLIQTYDVEDSAITTSKIKADNITSALIADDQINSEHYVAGSIDLEHMSANSIDSDQYVDGSIDEVHLSNSAVTQNKLANNSVGTPELINGSVNSDKILDGTIVNADVNASAAIAGTKVDPHFGSQNITTTGGLGIGGGAAITGDLDVDGVTTLDGATIDNIQIGITNDNEIDTSSGNLTIDSAGGTTTIDDALTVTGNVTLNGTVGVSGTTTASNITGGAVVTSGTSTSDTKVYSAKRAGEIFYGKGTVEEIQSGETWTAADDKVATTAAIDARIIDLVDDVGGFVAIANRDSFPTANPDVNNGAGTIVSITDAGGIVVQANGTSNNSQAAGATVTITGMSSLASTTIASGFGMLVETTTTLHTYEFRRLVPKATEVTTVATNATQVQTVHNNITQVQTVHNNITDIVAVANDASDIGAVAAKATQIGLLGTADAIADMNTLGTADIVADLNTLGTADVVADMNMLATSDVISDMNTLAVADVISDMNDLATSANITAMSNCSGSIANINTAASNLTNINNFANVYRIGSNNPSTSLDVGDLFFNTTTESLKVYTGSAWVDGVTQTGNFALKTGNTFTGDNIYNDGVEARFGTGGDLRIEHTGSFSKITNTTGNLNIFAANGGTIGLFDHTGTETLSKFTPNGATELYYDNSKKFETTSTGVHVLGNLEGDNLKASNPGNNALLIQNPSNGIIGFGANNQSNQVIITTDGHLGITGDSKELRFGAGEDLKIYHDGSDSFLKNATGHLRIYGSGTDDKHIYLQPDDGDDGIRILNNGAVKLYHNNVEKFETTSGGASVTGNLDVSSGLDVTGNITVTGTVDGVDIAALNTTVGNITTDVVSDTSPQLGGNLDCNNFGISLGDSDSIQFGDQGDFRINHNGVNGVIQNETGDLLINAKIGERAIDCTADGPVELYYDGIKKFETTSGGVKISGGEGVEAQLIFEPDEGDNASDKFRFRASDSSGFFLENGSSNDTSIKAVYAGAVELYHNNSKKIETESGGVIVQGNVTATGGLVVSGEIDLMGTQNNKYLDADLGSNSFFIRGCDGTNVNHENLAQFQRNAGSVLFYDNTSKLSTTSDGVTVSGDLRVDGSDINLMGSSDGNKFFDARVGSDSLQIRATSGGDSNHETMAKFFGNGAVELYHNNSKKFETESGGIIVTGGGSFSSGISIGGELDMMGTQGNKFIDCDLGSNALYIRGTDGTNVNHETLATFSRNGAVTLSYDNATKLATTSGGVNITGALTVNGSALGSFPDCMWTARMSSDQTISNQTETVLAFNTEVFDTESGFNTSTYKYTVPSGKAGRYFIYARGGIGNMDEGKQLNVHIAINGNVDTDGSPYNNRGMYNRHESGGHAEQIGEQVSVFVNLSVGDVVDARLWHNEGNPQNAQNYRGQFFGYRLSTQ